MNLVVQKSISQQIMASYTYSPLSEDSKVDKTTPTHADVEIDRRYLVTRKGATPEYLLPVKYIDESYDAFAPRVIKINRALVLLEN